MSLQLVHDAHTPDLARWEQHLRTALAAHPEADVLVCPAAFVRAALDAIDGLRDVARLVEGDHRVPRPQDIGSESW